MPTSTSTLERQSAPATGPISEREITAINEAVALEAAAWKAFDSPLPSPLCNGNCSQGRACDCVANVDDVRAPMTDSDRMWLGVLLGVSALLSLAVLAWAADAVRQAVQ